MAETTLDRGLTIPRIRFNAVEWVLTHRELLILLSLMAIAAGLRLWGLGDKALHHDESLHAQFTYQLFDGRGYQHDPLMHGPWLFHAGAAVFFLFGDSDYTGRLLPALFGTALVGMPFFLRRQIGWTAVIIAAVLIAFSPTLLYVSRFFRHDPYVIVWMFACVICIWRYLDEQRPRYLYLFALFLGLSFATMEITNIYAAIMLVYVDLMLAIELARARDRELATVDLAKRVILALPYCLAVGAFALSVILGLDLHHQLRFVGILVLLPLLTSAAMALVLSSSHTREDGRDEVVWAVILAPVAWLIAAIWPILGRRPFGREALPPIGDVMIVLGTLAVTQYGAAIEVLPFVGDRGYNAESERTLRNITVMVLLVGSAYVGLLWRAKDWSIVAAAFFIPYVLLFTTFFTNVDGFFSGIWGSLDYWLAQQEVQRGNQPGYYYALMSPLYEFLPLLVTIPGLIWLTLKGNSIGRFLVFWLAGIFAGLTIAGEKMPWLEVHIALPLALCAAVALARLVDSLEMDAKRWLTAAGVGAAVVVATLLLVEGDSQLTTMAGVLIAALVLGWLAGSAMSGGRLGVLRVLSTVAVAILLTLTIRAGYTVSFINKDVPVELLVYTQSSPEIPQLMDRIDSLARESGMGRNLPIAVDQTDGYAWPWAWYLRHYHDISYINEGSVAAFEPKEGSVLLIHANNVSQVDPLGYSQVPYKHRWWFNETYRNITWGKAWGAITNLQSSAGVSDTWTSLKALGDFFLYRRDPATTTGSTDSVAFFPESLAAFDRSQPVQPPPEPSLLPDGRIIFGRSGLGPGELLQAADVFVDPAGFIWVADSRSNRIHKFDAQGHYLSSLGRGGSDDGAFNQPWAVAVDADGFIYVADTWNHRIQKFSPEMQFILAWGTPTNDPNPTPLNLYGPRDIAIAADGTLWVTDTGHKRLINYTRDGEPLGVYGTEGAAPGQFSEPVGLAADAAGALYVADAWNGRIQVVRNGAAGVFAQTGWTSQEILHKPYIAVLADGRVVVTNPENSTLELYTATGDLVGRWNPAAGGLPVGIAPLADGGFVYADGRRNEVMIVPATAIAALFQK